MSNVNKIFVVFLLIAGVLCLAIGTVFAVDFMAEHPEEFACDLKKPVVAANRPLVPPVVEPPMMDIAVPSDGFEPGVYRFDLSVPVSSGSFTSSSSVTLSFKTSSSGDSVFRFPLFSTNITGLDEFIGELIVLEITYSASSSYAGFYIEADDGDFVLDVRLDGTNDYFVEVQTLDPFFVSFAGGNSVFIPAPSDFFQRVAPGVSIVGQIVDILMSGLTSTGEAIGQGLSTMANAIFINADGTGLSTFGTLIVVFASVSLALSLVRWVLSYVCSWGKRNR